MSERSQRNQSEAAEQTIRFFEALLHASADGIVITDASQNIILANEAFSTFFGQHRKDMIETNFFIWLELLDGNGPQRWAEMERSIRLKKLHRDIEFRLATGSRVRHLNVNCSLLEKVADEEAGVIISIWHDITERVKAKEALQKAHDELEMRVAERTAELAKANEELRNEIIERIQAEQKLASSNEELADFAYVVSHDLKAPLRGISQLTDWLSTDYADAFDEDGREMLSLLVGRARRMHDLIQGVLQYSRIGRIVEKERKTDLNALVRETIESLAPPENIHITIECKLPVVVREQTRIGQVFQNLVGNAIKFINKPEGRIRISCADKKTHWLFSVADNGPGIEEKYQTKIFQMFQTLMARDEVEGTGIGLALVKKIIEKTWDGQIWVESTVGKGSTFYFTLVKREEEK